MDTLNRLHEHISALLDDELPACEVELAMAALATAEGRAAWRAYQAIGDALRDAGQQLALSTGFEARLAARLAAEPDCVPVAGAAGAAAAEQGAAGDAIGEFDADAAEPPSQPDEATLDTGKQGADAPSHASAAPAGTDAADHAGAPPSDPAESPGAKAAAPAA